MEKQIVLYPGLLGRRGLMIHGHLIRRKAKSTPPPKTSRLKNLLYALDLYRVRPIKDRSIKIEWNGDSYSIETDSRGYFRLEVLEHGGNIDQLPREFRVWESGGLTREGYFFHIDPDKAGAISDIDDTLIISRAANPWKKFKLLVFRNAHTREATPELQRLFGKVQEFSELPDPVDFFYVSDSEWNLLPFLEAFFQVNRLPDGPFFLQQMQPNWWKAIFGGRPQKYDKQNRIEFLLRFFPEKSFVLIGDSSQRDMRIYAEVGKKFPERIAGIVIRVVDPEKSQSDIHHFGKTYTRLSIPFHFVEGH
ncbi:MAG: App1 family protein [Bacteroidota bacterium]|nr:App1 family protein [Bacteroidota bacterium]